MDECPPMKRFEAVFRRGADIDPQNDATLEGSGSFRAYDFSKPHLVTPTISDLPIRLNREVFEWKRFPCFSMCFQVFCKGVLFFDQQTYRHILDQKIKVFIRKKPSDKMKLQTRREREVYMVYSQVCPPPPPHRLQS